MFERTLVAVGRLVLWLLAMVGHVLRTSHISPNNEQETHHATAEALKFAFSRKTALW